MPRLSIWWLRTACLYLGLGFTFGALILWQKGSAALPDAWRLLPAHIEFLLLGWTLQLAFGVAYWILPRLRTAGAPTRGRERAAWWSYGLLNLGVLTVAATTWLSSDLQSAASFAGRLAELVAVALFLWHAWPRVKAAGSGHGAGQ
jgi:heme/copper-type cytochrome/quinol oxidase subunit 1